MSIDQIKSLSVSELAAPDCCLFLWVTDPMLAVGLDVIRAWGFTFKTVGFYWVKTNANGTNFTGMGYYTRANPEQCLLATRGNPKRVSKSVPRLIVAPRREHSRKPEEFFLRSRALMRGPYIELFSREPHDGWETWGDETSKFGREPQ
jgi:N6-adenosine-specific RNA methylase IME4